MPCPLAALCSRVSEMPRADRPFPAADLAEVIVGELHRELGQALIEAERRVLEGLQIDTEFETGKPNPQRALEIAILKKREREIGAYLVDEQVALDEDDTDDTKKDPIS